MSYKPVIAKSDKYLGLMKSIRACFRGSVYSSPEADRAKLLTTEVRDSTNVRGDLLPNLIDAFLVDYVEEDGKLTNTLQMDHLITWSRSDLAKLISKYWDDIHPNNKEKLVNKMHEMMVRPL